MADRGTMEKRPKKLLDRVREAIRIKHYSIRTEEAYVSWIKRYILFHHKRHPLQMGTLEIEAFLTHLALEQHVAASTQNQALNALVAASGSYRICPPARQRPLRSCWATKM